MDGGRIVISSGGKVYVLKLKSTSWGSGELVKLASFETFGCPDWPYSSPVIMDDGKIVIRSNRKVYVLGIEKILTKVYRTCESK